MTLRRGVRRLLLVLCAVLPLVTAPAAAAAPEDTLTFALHFSPVTRWLDPAEGESTITPFLLLYALHDGLLKPMPGAASAPSLAETWSMAKDGLSADFTLRAAKFHNGEPVTYLYQRQAKELDRKKREAILHQIQQILHDQATQAPVYHLGFPTGLGPRVEDILATGISGFYMSPYEDLRLRRP